jgi:2-C-methyl-D-erythritol 4-phosphate cytidylyltransferase
LHGKPVLVYTIEHFENHPEVDNIIVVCIEEWITELRHLLRQYMLDKVSQIVPGGDRGDISIYKGLRALEDVCKHDDIVLIHDGVRPLINAQLISKNIAKAKECGNAITIEAATESIVRIDSTRLISDIPPRHDMYHAKAPQTFKFGYKRAFSEGIQSYDSAHLCGIYGEKMHTVMSTPNNLKITTPADYFIFRALYEAMENEQIFGY